MKPTVFALAITAISMASPLSAHAAQGTATDRSFVAKVSQGGMFEVKAGKLAEQKASAQNVKNFAIMEVHDHILVGDKLKAISSKAGIPIDANMNAEFSGKMAKLMTLSGSAFDKQYMMDMGDLHPKDGAAFLKESMDGGGPDFRAFGAETHKIVERHIGAIQATPPS